MTIRWLAGSRRNRLLMATKPITIGTTEVSSVQETAEARKVMLSRRTFCMNRLRRGCACKKSVMKPITRPRATTTPAQRGRQTRSGKFDPGREHGLSRVATPEFGRESLTLFIIHQSSVNGGEVVQD